MKKFNLMRTCMLLAGLSACGILASGCVEETTDHQYDDVCSYGADGTLNCNTTYTKAFRVFVSATDMGSKDAPIKFAAPKWKDYNAYTKTIVDASPKEDGFKIGIAAYAVDVHGNFNPDFNGTVTLKSVPGELDTTQVTFQNGLLGSWTTPSDPANGTPSSYENVQLRYAYGPTRLWIEDATENQFGIREGSLATGVSDEFYFEDQTIRTVQYNPDQPDGTTPLLKQFGSIKSKKGHDLVVSNVVSTGFYVTDVGEEGLKDGYNSIFIYSYSQPSRVDIGDRVCEVSGGIAEFTGMTQLQFPSWGIQNKERSTAEDTDPAPEDGDNGAGTCIDKDTGLARPCTDEELANMGEIVDCWSAFEPERAAECTDEALDQKYGSNPAERAVQKQKCKAEKEAFAYIQPPQPLNIDWRVLMCGSDGSTSNRDTGKNPDKDACIKLEAMESSIITIENVELSNYFIDCDDNGNSKIDSNTDEATCRNECNNNPGCTEYSNLDSYDQWRARAIGSIDVGYGGSAELSSEISVASSSLVSGFNILNGCITVTDTNLRKNIFCQNRRFKRLTGTFKQVLPGCYAEKINTGKCMSASEAIVMSVIEPRFASDLIEDDAYNQCEAKKFIEYRDKCAQQYHITVDSSKPQSGDPDVSGFIDCMMSSSVPSCGM